MERLCIKIKLEAAGWKKEGRGREEEAEGEEDEKAKSKRESKEGVMLSSRLLLL